MFKVKTMIKGAAVALLGSMVISSAANAVPLVTEWTLTADAVFANDDASAIYNTTTYDNSSVLTEGAMMSWGSPYTGTEPPSNPNCDGTAADPDCHSHLVLNDQNYSPNAGDAPAADGHTVVPNIMTVVNAVATAADMEDAATLTHFNNIILGPFVTTFQIIDSLTLTVTDGIGLPFIPPLDLLGSIDLVFDVRFLETPNSAPCVVIGGPECGDIFVMDDLSALSSAFDFLGRTYTAHLGFAGGSILTDAECAAVGKASGCFGFTTTEGGVTTIQTRVWITTSEPGMLALLGFALLGMGLIRRRV